MSSFLVHDRVLHVGRCSVAYAMPTQNARVNNRVDHWGGGTTFQDRKPWRRDERRARGILARMASDDEQELDREAPAVNTAELHPKRTTSFAARRKKKPPVCVCVLLPCIPRIITTAAREE